MDIVQQMAEEAAVMARLGVIFHDPAELNLCRQRLYERERKFATQVASVWMAIADQLRDSDALDS